MEISQLQKIPDQPTKAQKMYEMIVYLIGYLQSPASKSLCAKCFTKPFLDAPCEGWLKVNMLKIFTTTLAELPKLTSGSSIVADGC